MSFAVHGGAGRVRNDSEILLALGKALDIGIELVRAGDPISAVVEALAFMEETGLFNAGRGAAPNSEGMVQMDAGIMDGRSLKVGAVGAAYLKSPIRAALDVMMKTPHSLIAGGNGMRGYGIGEGGDTIGAVAATDDGWYVAASSTGGVRGKMPGRIGDAAIAGAGFYALNKTGATALTGIGEQNMRVLTAFRIINLMKEKNALEALIDSFSYIKTALGEVNQGGIAIDSGLRVGIYHTEPQMPACAMNGDRRICGINFENGLLL
ncbi:MAG: isoaspartyl peptidase/L-asparaginase [Nitrososphaeria archaeon]